MFSGTFSLLGLSNFPKRKRVGFSCKNVENVGWGAKEGNYPLIFLLKIFLKKINRRDFPCCVDLFLDIKVR